MLVIQQLEHLNAKVDELDKDLAKLDKDVCREIALLKQKAGLWGAIAAFLMTAAVQLALKFIK